MARWRFPLFVCLLSAALMTWAGCTSYLSYETPERTFYKEWVLEESIEDIAHAMEYYQEHCGMGHRFFRFPTRPRKAMVKLGDQAASFDGQHWGVVVFEQDKDTALTTARAYIYNNTWNESADRLIILIKEGGSRCFDFL